MGKNRMMIILCIAAMICLGLAACGNGQGKPTGDPAGNITGHGLPTDMAPSGTGGPFGPDVPSGAPGLPTGGPFGPDMPSGAPEMPSGAPEMPSGAPEIPTGGPDVPSGWPFGPDMPSGMPFETPTPTPVETADPYNIYWWKQEFGNDSVIFDADTIKQLNVENATKNIGLADLNRLESVTAEQVRTMIYSYTFPSKDYIGSRKITQADKDRIQANRAVDDQLKDFRIRYAVVTENTGIRAFPADDFVTNEAGLYDYLQETGVDYGEPVAVYADSADGNWCFVQANDYFGWVKKSAIAFCDRDGYSYIADAFAKGKLWCAYKTGEYRFETREGQEIVKFIRMGTYLVCMNGEIYLPERDNSGNVIYTAVSIPAVQGGSVLAFTLNNLFDAFANALGTPYSWGDLSETGMDCSSTAQSIFRIFGIFLPRNSSQQAQVALTVKNLDGLDNTEKISYIREQPAGTILYMPGHIMMLLGEYDGELYILHNTTNSARDDGGTDAYNACVITKITIGKTGNTLLDRIKSAVTFKK